VALLAADGPTIYDVATAVIALAGLGLSAYGLRRQVKRETRSVTVTCRYRFVAGPMRAVAPEHMVSVEVLNEGHRPVELTGVGFEFPDGRQPVTVPLEGPVTFPKPLGDGQTASFYFDLAALERAEADIGQTIRTAFATASGQRYRGDFVKR
jgi:hypothetical protein